MKLFSETLMLFSVLQWQPKNRNKWARTDTFFGLHSIISTILAIGIEHAFRFILLRCLLVLFHDHRGQLLCSLDSRFVRHDHRQYLTIFYGFIHFNFILRMSLSIVGQTSPPGFMAWERKIEEDKRKISISIELAFYYDKNKTLG